MSLLGSVDVIKTLTSLVQEVNVNVVLIIL